jgi:gluconate 2-dehydrogenase gamma chain
MSLSRREFMSRALTVGGALLGGALSWTGCASFGGRFVLSSLERRTLAAAAARILPSDDGPGAVEAGAIDAIERALASSYHRALREPFRMGAAALNRIAREHWQAEFAGLSSQDQDSVLGFVESGKADTAEFPASRFLDRMITLTLEGYLGDPVHGGNRDEVGWRFIGYRPGVPRPGACENHEHR